VNISTLSTKKEKRSKKERKAAATAYFISFFSPLRHTRLYTPHSLQGGSTPGGGALVGAQRPALEFQINDPRNAFGKIKLCAYSDR
jgi:hypothetical protein